MGPVPDGATARSAGGLPEVGQHAVFRAPDECLRWMGWKDDVWPSFSPCIICTPPVQSLAALTVMVIIEPVVPESIMQHSGHHQCISSSS